MMSVDQLLDEAIAMARCVLIGEPGASLIPTYVIRYKDRPTTIVGAPWSGEEDKVMTLAMMRFMMREEKAQSYSFTSEAWMATETLSNPIGLMPSEREDKREVVIINAFDLEGGKMRVYEIERDPDGRVMDLVLDTTVLEFEGRMFNLLKEEDSQLV